ncbi:MAG: GntR family transcriptional regulator, partial [Clostridia bacterium]|nr:GntR family transcriptional regulator [Clostridia bacterium]
MQNRRGEGAGAKLNLRTRIFQVLEQDILNGKYPSGTNLTEKELCEEFGVSRTPLREALCQLELEGLVECIPNKGAVVLGISDQDINDIYAIELALDGLAARLA